MLVKPSVGERLWLYLAMSKVVVSAVLVKQDGVDQLSVYYVSYLFKGEELHYTGLKKLMLELFLTTRHLRLYFLLHPIIVLIDTPFGRILTHP